jgi:alcohol dehydrogenase (NADP+)
MEKLVRPDGPTRFIGISNFNETQVDELLASATIKPKTHQFELHPYLQQPDFVAYHARVGIPVTAYAAMGNMSPFYARGLIGNPTKPPKLASNPVLAAIGAARGCSSAAQVGLAWNMGRGVAALVKAAQTAHARENVEALGRCVLTEEDVRTIEDMQARWSVRVNNPCSYWRIPCFAGLMNEKQGTYPLLLT